MQNGRRDAPRSEESVGQCLQVRLDANDTGTRCAKNLVIRAYAESDEAQVIQLWREVSPDNPSWNVPKADIDRKLAVQRELFLVGDLDGEIVGTVMAGFDGHRGWVHLVAVAPKHRQQGFARATGLWQTICEIHCRRCYVEVSLVAGFPLCQAAL
jgi:GNAT superfamily N-acetyltransferase